MTTAVLVHGAWHGAWCFDRVVARLDDAGIGVVAVDLPGHGDDDGPFTDLHGDAGAVRAVLDELGDDVVLLGHSYGGAVVTEAGVHPAVRHVVYLCAFALGDGESCMVAASSEAEATAIDMTGRPDLAAGLVFRDDGTSTVDAATARTCFFHDCDDETAAWALARLGPQPMQNLAQAPDVFAWRSVPSTYVVCTEDLAVHPDLQRIFARRCTTTLEWPTSHSPFLSRPDLVAGLVADLVRAPG